MGFIATDNHDFTTFTPIITKLLVTLRTARMLNVPDIIYAADDEGERTLLWDYIKERFHRRRLDELFVDRPADTIIAKFNRTDYTQLV
jgi:hypothetical protein